MNVVENYGKYDLLERIGQGGMAEVYLARLRDSAPEAPYIVIKRLHRELERDPNAVDLFITEADVTLLLNHPNIIKVYESGEINDRYYMAMEYLDGTDLEKMMRFTQGRNIQIPFEYIFHIMKEILSGLEYVHHARSPSGKPLGIVHRDVTPSNIWISKDGRIILGDFGVAKLIGVESWTMAGSIKGKLGYFAPEQIAGEEVAQSFDLYAAGIILYELCTGKPCFTGKTELDIMLNIRKARFARPRKYRKDMPRSLDKLIRKVLHRKPHKRHQDASEFKQDLEMLMSDMSKPITNDELVAYMRSLTQNT